MIDVTSNKHVTQLKAVEDPAQFTDLHSKGVWQLHIEELKVGIVHRVYTARHHNRLLLLPSNLHITKSTPQTKENEGG